MSELSIIMEVYNQQRDTLYQIKSGTNDTKA